MKTTVSTFSVMTLLLTGTSLIIGTSQAQAQAQACTYDIPTSTYTCNDTGVGIDESKDDDQIVNIGATGDIDSGSEGVRLDNRNTITNDGSIEVSDDGVDVDNENTIVNNGSIIAGDNGIEAGNDNPTITNSATGTIKADDKGIDAGNNNTITNDGSIIAGDEGIEAGDDNDITNSGTITSGKRGIRAGDDNKITNDGSILVGNENGSSDSDEEGIEVGDDNVITNSATGTIAAENRGIKAGDDNDIINAGSIMAIDDGMDVGKGNTITNSGTIESHRRAIHAESGNTITNDGTISISGNHAAIEMGDDNTVINNGSITSDLVAGGQGIEMGSNGNTVTINGSILTRKEGILSQGGNDGDTNTIINNGTIQSTEREAIELGDGNDAVTNNGILIGGGTYAVRMGDGDDTFTWQALSRVTGEVDMGDGSGDTLVVESANVFGSTTFRSLEAHDIAIGSAAILEDLSDGDYILHTANPTLLATAGAMVGGLAHDITRRLLHAEGAASQGGQVTKGVQVTQATQGSGGDGSWWGVISTSSQNDSGQGFEQDSQNITIGKSMGQFDLFVGYESASADMTATTDSSDQDMFYIGASTVFQLNPNLDFMGVALIGGTSTDYSTTGGSMDGDGFFYSISGGVNYSQSGFVAGAYLGYAALDTDAMSTGTIAFASQDSDAYFGGIDLSLPKYDIGGGVGINAVIGFGFQNGAADAVSMSAGGSSTTVAGTDTNQDFGMVGFDISTRSVTGAVRLRTVGGASSTLNVWVRGEF